MAFALQHKVLTRGLIIPRCASCGRDSKPLNTGGQGKRKILIVFEQPSEAQHEQDDWFAEHRFVYTVLRQRLGINPKEDCYVTGVYRCNVDTKPKKSVLGSSSQKPAKKPKYEDCVCGLYMAIKQTNPVLIITVGSVATGAVLRLYNGAHFGLGRSYGQYVGRVIPLLKQDGYFGCWLAPVMSTEEIKSYNNPKQQMVAQLWFEKHIMNAYAKIADFDDVEQARPKPLEHPPIDYLSTSTEIEEALNEACMADYTAFDYETNCLQPEPPFEKEIKDNKVRKPRVLCVALAYGNSEKMQRVVAFSMPELQEETHFDKNRVVCAWRKFLRSKSKKIVANVKFEERWSTVYYEQPIENFYWDVCIGGRVLECISGMSGLKYLTFVYFGVIGYDDDVSNFMDNEDSRFNSLEEVSNFKLLKYNSLDSIYTYALAIIQHKELRIEWEK